MTVYKEQKIAKILINNHNRMNELDDQDQSMITNDSQIQNVSPGLYGIECNVGGDILSPSQISGVPNDIYFNGTTASDFEPFSRYFLEEWSGVEHLYRVAIRPEQELYWSQSPPSPPPPIAFGINNDLVADDPFEEENIQDLVSALDNIILAQPNTSHDHKEENLGHVRVNIYAFEPIPSVSTILPKLQELARNQEDLPDGESYPTMENISGYTP